MQVWLDSLFLQNPSVGDLWRFLPLGYVLTVLIEFPFLWLLLPKLTFSQRLWFGAWLTACTYPIVILVLPNVMEGYSRGAYLLVAETFAPLAECFLFWISLRNKGELDKWDWMRSFAAITIANLASFAIGEILWVSGVYLNA